MAWSLNLLKTPTPTGSATSLTENSPPTRGEDNKSTSKPSSGGGTSPSVEFKNHPGGDRY